MNWWLSEQVGRMAERRERTAMAYSKEFEEWLKEAIKHEEVLTWHELASPLSKRAAHFWLAAFTKAVREEALDEAKANGWSCESNIELGRAFNALCERFGIKP